VCVGVELTFVCVDAGGVEVVVETVAAGGGAGGGACTLALVEADATGVLALTCALTAGDVDPEVETLTETGVPGRPSACAATAKDRLQMVTASNPMKQRKRRFRHIIVSFLENVVVSKVAHVERYLNTNHLTMSTQSATLGSAATQKSREELRKTTRGAGSARQASASRP
jgi:hypothetical protein